MSIDVDSSMNRRVDKQTRHGQAESTHADKGNKAPIKKMESEANRPTNEARSERARFAQGIQSKYIKTIKRQSKQGPVDSTQSLR